MTDNEREAVREMMSQIRAAYVGIAKWAVEYPGLASQVGTYDRIGMIMHVYDEMAYALEQAGMWDGQYHLR